MSRIIFVRHGACKWNNHRETRLRGRSNLGLTPEGLEQADRLASCITRSFGYGQNIYSSPLERAKETARAINKKAGGMITFTEDLTGVDVGSWQGKTLRSLLQRYGDLYKLERYDNGESYDDVMRRVTSLLRRLPEEATIVSHGDPIAAAIASIKGVRHEEMGKFYSRPGSISIVEDGELKLFDFVP